MPFTLYLLALAIFVMGTSEFMLAGLVPAMAPDLHVTVGVAGLLTSAFAIGMVVGAPLTAIFARRWPPRPALLICLLAFAGSHVVSAVAESVAHCCCWVGSHWQCSPQNRWRSSASSCCKAFLPSGWAAP